MSVPKLKEDKLKRLMTYFSEPKYISMFGQLLWFIYKGPDTLEKMAK